MRSKLLQEYSEISKRVNKWLESICIRYFNALMFEYFVFDWPSHYVDVTQSSFAISIATCKHKSPTLEQEQSMVRSQRDVLHFALAKLYIDWHIGEAHCFGGQVGRCSVEAQFVEAIVATCPRCSKFVHECC